MSDLNNTEVIADEIVAAEAPSAEEPTVASDEKATNSNREAAKYRRQAREAEAARDALGVQLTAARTSIVGTALTQGVTVDALLAAGHTIDAMFTDTGELDQEVVAAAAKEVAERFNIAQPSPRSHALGRANPVSPENAFGNAWGSAFKPTK